FSLSLFPAPRELQCLQHGRAGRISGPLFQGRPAGGCEGRGPTPVFPQRDPLGRAPAPSTMGTPTAASTANGLTTRPLSGYEQMVRRLSDRLVEAQRPIRILDAIKWDDDIERAFFAAGCRELP